MFWPNVHSQKNPQLKPERDLIKHRLILFSHSNYRYNWTVLNVPAVLQWWIHILASTLTFVYTYMHKCTPYMYIVCIFSICLNIPHENMAVWRSLQLCSAGKIIKISQRLYCEFKVSSFFFKVNPNIFFPRIWTLE